MQVLARYTRLIYLTVILAPILTSCSKERGGVFIDSSGEQGGGTQPGGGGFAFVILFLVVAISVTAIFTMDRIKKDKQSDDDSPDNNNS